MLHLHEVSVGWGTRTVLTDVSLRIAPDEFVAVAGPTGSGKSTLLGVLAGLVPAFGGGWLRGEVTVDGRSLPTMAARERAPILGYVPQDPLRGFVTDTVEEELAFGMEQLGLAPRVMRRRVEETLDVLGIANLRNRDLRTLSGGQQQRVAIGSVLAAHPRALILDEPTSALDPTAADEVLAILARLVADLGVSVVLAEHRLERVLPFADRFVELDGSGRARTAEHPDAELTASVGGPPILALGRRAGWEPLPLTVRTARRRAALTDWGPPPPASPLPTERPVVELAGAVAAYGERVAVNEVDLAVHAGEVCVVMGRNGSGKSTLLWTIQGGHPLVRGSVRVAQQSPRALTPAGRRDLVGLVPQTATDLLCAETVADEVAHPRAARWLSELAPEVVLDSHPRDLSEGQQLAVAIAVVAATEPPVLCLDEPTRGLDYHAKHALAQGLRGLAARGTCVLLSTHDVEFAAQVADSVALLAQGELIGYGPARELLSDSPSLAPQLSKILGPGWLTLDDLATPDDVEVAP